VPVLLRLQLRNVISYCIPYLGARPSTLAVAQCE